MKKLIILLLTVFTIGTAVACGCGGEKTNSHDNKNNEEPVRIQEIEEVEQDGQDERDKKPECPDKGKRDGELPTPRKPHKWPHKKHPHPKHSYRR